MTDFQLRGLVVSPSAPCVSTEEKREAFEQGLAVLGEMGLAMREAPHARGVLGYVAATETERLADLREGYEDASVDFLMAGTGGWNAGGLLADVDWDVVRRNPKPLVGFSDISVLQVALYARTGVRQLHAPMVRYGMAEATDFTKQSLLAGLRGDEQVVPLAKVGRFVKGERLEGTVIAGNLVSLATLLGTPYAPDWENVVLCWEETEETVFRIERALTHFKNAGVWERLAGMVIGDIDQSDEDFNGVRTPVMEMVGRHFAGYDFPIVKTELFGHRKGTDFLTLPTGGRMVVEAGALRVR